MRLRVCIVILSLNILHVHGRNRWDSGGKCLAGTSYSDGYGACGGWSWSASAGRCLQLFQGSYSNDGGRTKCVAEGGTLFDSPNDGGWDSLRSIVPSGRDSIWIAPRKCADGIHYTHIDGIECSFQSTKPSSGYQHSTTYDWACVVFNRWANPWVLKWQSKPCSDTYDAACQKWGECTSCATGKKSGEGATSCSNCNNGQFQNEGGKSECKTCGVGEFTANDNNPKAGCTACTAGYYQGSGGQNNCDEKCAAGKISGAGASACSNCYNGKSQNLGGQSVCNDCVAGKFTTNVNEPKSECTACTAGYFQGLTIQNNCDNKCLPGQYSPAGASACTPCPAYSHSPEASGASTDCKCNAGYTGPDGGTCTSCAAGKHKSQTGSAGCTDCLAGTFSTAVTATSIDTCGNCAAGKVSAAGATACSNCFNGQYQPLAGKSACNTCLTGEFTASDNNPKTECTHCLPGNYQPDQGTTTCIACVPGKYQTAIRQAVCTECAAGMFSGTTAATHPDFCLECRPGTYSPISASTCTECIKGKYNTAAGLSTCTLCVGEQAYAPDTGMTTCYQCPEKRQISDLLKTYCFVCLDGEEENRPLSRCDKCPIGKYSDGTTNRKCVPCKEGTYTTTVGTDVCKKCNACPDSFYRVGCTITQGGGTCIACEKCADPKTEVRVDCMNRAGHNNASGICRKRKFTVRNPYCDNDGSGYFLGGYNFNELFGTSQDNADFQCRGICDGVTNRLTAGMKANDSYLMTYSEQSFDSGYCKGPYACDVPTCVIYGVSDDSQPAYRLPAACPVIIEDAVAEQLWPLTLQADYEQHPLTVAVQNMRYNVECQGCSACGDMSAEVLKAWPLMQNYTDWGRGCARECTELSCAYGEIFDWSVADATSKCKTCSELEDVRLCTSRQQQAFAGADVSGNLPKLTFKDCLPRRIVQFGIARASYGDCLRCPETTDACGAGFYYKTCDTDLKPTCEKCDTRATASSAYFNGNASLPLYCQKTLCADGVTGVSVDVLPHRTCHRQCSKTKCASDRVELPCLLPHDKRCKASMTYASFPTDEMYKKQGYAPAHANVLERVSGLHLYASFENLLVSVESIPLQRRRVCVWNANGITDNDMNPAGVSAHFQEACRPWTRDPGISYPLLPLQNTVTDNTEFQRRILLNTSATAMHYLSEWHEVVRIPNVFTGDLFLDVELTNASHTALVAFVSPDRLLSNVTSVVRWHVSVYAQQTVGLRDDVLLHIETPDDVQPCDACFSLQLACVPPSCARATLAINASLACSTAPHSASRTSAVAAAWQDFCGDRFHVSVPTGSVYVCGASMQRRVVPAYTASHAALAVLAGELDVACAQGSLFAAHVPTSHVLVGGSEALAGKCCLGFVFSNTSVFCVSVLGALHAVSDSSLRPDAFTIRGVVVYRDTLITTVRMSLREDTTSYVASMSSICAALTVTGRVLNANADVFNHTRFPLFMLAAGNPLYFLSRVESATETSMMLRKYSCDDILQMTSTFCESDLVPVTLFSGRLPSVETRNTLLHARGGGLLFVTSTHSPTAGTVVMAVFVASGAATRRSVALTTEAQDVVYPNNGEVHRISGAWLTDSVYVLSLEDQQQMWMLTLETNIAFALLPPAKSMFSHSFIALGGAVLSRTAAGYSLTACMPGCTTSTRDTAAYFAFGDATLTYTRLLPCRDADLSHVNPLDLQQAPARTCAVAEFNRSGYSMQYALALKCKQAAGVVSASLTVEAGAVVRITSRNASTVLAGNASQLVFMYAQCVNMTVAYVRVFDRFACGGGCRLYNVTQIQITGKVHLNYVLHSALQPRDSMIYTLLRSSTYALARPPVPVSFDSWTQHSAFTHSLADLQRVQVNLIRRTPELFELAEPTHVALDVLEVVPTLNVQAVLHVLSTNVSALLTLVHIPSEYDLAQLALDSTVRGSEVSGWRRLHATAFLRPPPGSLLGCVFDLRLVAVDDTFTLLQASSRVGCRLLVQAEGANAVGRCHVEVPFAMANAGGVVGLLAQGAGACELPPPASLTVELVPFTSMSECPQHQFLDADTAKCAPCELQDAVCGAGFYAPGCEAMLGRDMLSCLPCPVPPRALFANTSVTCSDWLCEASFFRAASLCLNCTAVLQPVCARTAGQMWAPCSGALNEQCVACPLTGLPRNAEWTNESQCAWQCQPSYFSNNGICEACLSLKILKSVLAIQGTRTPGAFYKFRSCTGTRQAEFSTCQFGQQLNVTYTSDAAEFLRDCPGRCAEYLHVVDTTVTDSENATWRAAQCIQCPLASQPTYVNASLVPRSAYDMDASCLATCRADAEHYAVEGGGRCAYCPPGRCAAGQYSATEDGCASCRNCSSNLLGVFVFEREGLVNQNTSCREICAPGYYLSDNGVQCLPHTDVRCVAGQFKVNGTARSDARCDECTDCTGYRQVRDCSLTQDAQCESCGPLVWWSSFWNGTACELACRSAYTKLHMPRARCQRCSACPSGFERVSRPANCSDCRACSPPKPQHAEYISQCVWKCEKYHALRLDDDTALPLCVYSVDWSTNVPAASARRQYNVSCDKGQILTDELLCADCAAPPGLNQSRLNAAWVWTGVGCAWQCVPGLMHVVNSTAQQNSCLTRAEYLALVVARRVPLAPAVRSLNYSILLMVVVPLTFAMVACGVLKTG